MSKFREIEVKLEAFRQELADYFEVPHDAIGLDVYIHRSEKAWREATRARWIQHHKQGVYWRIKGNPVHGTSITVYPPRPGNPDRA